MHTSVYQGQGTALNQNYFSKLFVKWEKVARLDHLIIVCLDKYVYAPIFHIQGAASKVFLTMVLIYKGLNLTRLYIIQKFVHECRLVWFMYQGPLSDPISRSIHAIHTSKHYLCDTI